MAVSPRLESMAMPRRTDVEDFLAHLDPTQREHVDLLRELSRTADSRVEETLHWNQPAYLMDGVRLWVIQAFKGHCSLRFPPGMFAAHRAEVEAAGYEAGEGFVKIPYSQPVPVELCKSLIRARIDQFLATGAKWDA